MKCTLPGHTYQVRALDFSHDDSFLLSGAADETVMIWQMDEATLETEVRQFESFMPCLHPSLDCFASMLYCRKKERWRASTA